MSTIPTTSATESLRLGSRATGLSVSRLTWAGQASLAILDQGLISGSNFAIGVLLARWLTPAHYGAYALAFSIFLFVSGFHNALLLEPMSVLGPSQHRNRLPEYLGELIWLHFGLIAALCFLFSAGLFLLGGSSGITASAFWGVGAAMPWILFFWLWRRAAYLAFKPWWAARSAALYALVVFVLLIVAARLHWLSPLTAFLVQAIAAFAASVLLIVAIRPQLRVPTLNASLRSVVRQHWEYGRWVVATGLVYWLAGAGGAYYVLVAALLRMEDVAALRALQNFVQPVYQFITAMSLLVLPWAAARFAERGRAGFPRAIKGITLLFGAVAAAYLLVLVVFGDRLVGALYEGKYSHSAHLLPLVALPVVLSAASQGPVIALQAMREPREVFVSYSAAALATILIGLAFTYYWGLTGAALGILASMLVFSIVISLRYHTRLKEAPPSKSTSKDNSNGKDVRVAWLLPSMDRGFYWQPVFREVTKHFPKTVIFTGIWPGFLKGYEGAFQVRILRGVKWVVLKRSVRGYDSGFLRAPFSLLWELLRLRPQVILVSGFQLWTLFGVLLKFLLGSRVVLLWDGSSPSIDYLNAPARLMFRRVMACFLDACLSNTDEGVRYLREVLRIPDLKLLRHPYEVPDLEVLDSQGMVGEFPESMGRPVFLYVGQLIGRKGVDRLLRACNELRQRGLAGFSVVIAGDGEDRDKLRELATVLDLEKQVHWVGSIPYEELGAYYKSSDVFVFPTLEDIWGLVAVEAMAFGKPVLCSKYAGSKEMVLPGENGFVFDPEEPGELTKLMARFIESPRLIEKMGARSKEIMAPYTPRAAADVLAAAIAATLPRAQGATYKHTRIAD